MPGCHVQHHSYPHMGMAPVCRGQGLCQCPHTSCTSSWHLQRKQSGPVGSLTPEEKEEALCFKSLLLLPLLWSRLMLTLHWIAIIRTFGIKNVALW